MVNIANNSLYPCNDMRPSKLTGNTLGLTHIYLFRYSAWQYQPIIVTDRKVVSCTEVTRNGAARINQRLDFLRPLDLSVEYFSQY